MDAKETIAKRIAKEIKDGDVVNLGIGLPILVANYISDSIDVTFHSENGFIGLDRSAEQGEGAETIVNAGGQPVTVKKGAAFFDSAMSFGIVRGGHIDITVLGGLQAAENGDLANYMVPGKIVPGMGGAMDLVTGAKKVIVAMTHTAKGEPKIVKQCSLPLTGKGIVSMIVTEMAVFEVTNEGLLLKEINSRTTLKEVLEKTAARVIVQEKLIRF